MSRLGAGRPAGEGGHDRQPGGGACRPPGGGDRGDKRQHQGGGHRPPRQGEAVDAVLHDRLHEGGDDEPDRQTDHCAHRGCGGTHGRAVGEHDQAHVPVGGPEGPEHPESPQAALGHHRKSGHRQQPHEEEPDGGQDQHYGLNTGLALGAPLADPDTGPVREPERLEALLVGIHQDRHAGGRGDLTRRHQRELVLQVEGVLDHPDHREGPTVLRCQLLPTCRPKAVADAARHRHLIGSGRVTAGVEAQRDPDIMTSRVGVPHIDGGDRTRDGDGLVRHHVRGPEGALHRGDVGVELVPGTRDLNDGVGGAEGWVVVQLGGVRDDRQPDGRGRHRHHQERQHERLATPLPAEHPPGPADHRPAGRAPAIA